MWSNTSLAPYLSNHTSEHRLVACHWMQDDQGNLKNHMATFAVYQNLLQIAIIGQMGSRGVKFGPPPRILVSDYMIVHVTHHFVANLPI